MTKVYILSQTNARDLIEWLRQGHVNRVGAALENLLLVDDPRTVNAELLEALQGVMLRLVDRQETDGAAVDARAAIAKATQGELK